MSQDRTMATSSMTVTTECIFVNVVAALFQ